MQQEMSFTHADRSRGSRSSSLTLIIALHLMIAWFMLQKTGKIQLFTYDAPSRITQFSMLSSGVGSGATPAEDIAVGSMPAPALPRLDFGPAFAIKAEATTEDAATVHASPVTQARNEPTAQARTSEHAATISTGSGSMADRSAGPGTGTGMAAGTSAGKGAGSSAGPDAFESLPAAVLAVDCGTPAYPFTARERGQEGTTRMALLIDAQGRVIESRVMKSSRSLALDRASRDAIALCRFVPQMQNGVPTSGWVSLNYIWKLRETMGVFRDAP